VSLFLSCPFSAQNWTFDDSSVGASYSHIPDEARAGGQEAHQPRQRPARAPRETGVWRTLRVESLKRSADAERGLGVKSLSRVHSPEKKSWA